MTGWRLLHDVDSCDERLIRYLGDLGWDCARANVHELSEVADAHLLRLAVAEQRVLYTANERDFARLHAIWQRTGLGHRGIVIRGPQRARAEAQRDTLVALFERFGPDISNQLLWARAR